MKKEIYLIAFYEIKNGNYKGTMNVAFETRDLAKGYALACDNEKYRYVLIKVPYHTQYEQK